MMPPGDDQRLQAQMQPMRVLWGAMLFSQLMLFGVLIYLRTTGFKAMSTGVPLETMTYGAAGIALIPAMAWFFLPDSLNKAFKERTREKMRSKSDIEKMLMALPQARVTMILGCALAEAISLLGLWLGLMGQELMLVAPFFLLGLMLVSLKIPSENTIRSLTE